MKKLKKRILSGIISFSMILTMFPVSVFATDYEDGVLDWWQLSNAFYDDKENCFVLTEGNKTWDAGAIWYNAPIEGDFQLELDYYTGVSDTNGGREHGADGIAVAFYANSDYTATGGKGMGFNGSIGYGIELDTNCNPDLGDPRCNHISLIKETTGNHLVQAELPESEDDMWHHLKICVENQICYAYVDNSLKLQYTVEKTGYNQIGITASTGIFTNKHAVKNIVVTADNDGDDGNNNAEDSTFFVDVFSDYDAEKRQAIFGINPDIYTYQVTDTTDMSFLDQLDNLLGQYVLVHYTSGKYGEDDLTRYILSITPANIQTGTVEAITESSITINGKTYSADFEDWFGLDSYIGQSVVSYFNNDTVIYIKILEEKTGVLNAGSNTTVTIDNIQYSAIFNDIPPFLLSPELWFDQSITYWIADNIVYKVELPDYNATSYKRLDKIEGKTAYFHDRSQYEIADNVSIDTNMIGRWVKISLLTSVETGTQLTDIQILKPSMSIKVEMAEKRNICLEDNKYSYDGEDPVPSSQFEIVYRVIVSNTTPHDSEEDLKLMKSDPSLTITFENLEVIPPKNFNSGWTGSGEIPNVSGTTLCPGEIKEGRGYVRPGMFFFVDDNDISVTEDIQINLQTTAGEYSGQTSFTILNLDYTPPKPKEDVFNDATVKSLGKKAADELDALYNSSNSGIVLNIDTMSRIFGIQGKELELFEKELLTEVIMSSAPEDDLSEQISDSLMSYIYMENLELQLRGKAMMYH